MNTNCPFAAGAQIAAYLRDSGGEEQDLSIEQQTVAVRQWCAQHKLHLTRIYIDAARPGSSTIQRDQFHELMRHFRDSSAPESGIIVWKYSRFARNIDDSQFYKADLRRRGYIIHSLQDNIPESSEGRFLEAAIDWMNDRFLDDLSTDVKRGLNHLVTQYGCVPGTPPAGFTRQPVQIGTRRDGRPHLAHKWVPNPQTIPLVRKAFQMRAAGQTIKAIHEQTHLYKSTNSYTTFFRNELYIGTLVFGEQRIENYCEPVIDEQTWHIVQQISSQRSIEQRPRHPRQVSSEYLLSGLAVCAQCSAPLIGHNAQQRNGSNYRRYQCSRAARKAGCTAPRIPAATIEKAILNEISNYILTPSVLTAAQTIAEKQNSAQTAKLADERAAYHAQLKTTRKQLSNLIAAIAESGHSRAILTAITQLEQTEETLLQNIEKATTPPQIPKIENLHAAAAAIREKLPTLETTAKKNILTGLIHRITLERTENSVLALIEWYLPPTNDTVPIPHVPLGALWFTHSITIRITSKKAQSK